jgi:hypothetical protein
MSLGVSAAALPKIKSAAVTAGTRRPRPARRPSRARSTQVTTGNANDGVCLPRADAGTTGGAGGNCLDGAIIVENLSANALKVYPFYDTVAAAGDGSQINAGGANTVLQPGRVDHVHVRLHRRQDVARPQAVVGTGE